MWELSVKQHLKGTIAEIGALFSYEFDAGQEFPGSSFLMIPVA